MVKSNYIRNNERNILKLKKIKLALALARHKVNTNVISFDEYLELLTDILTYLDKTLDDIKTNEELFLTNIEDTK